MKKFLLVAFILIFSTSAQANKMGSKILGIIHLEIMKVG